VACIFLPFRFIIISIPQIPSDVNTVIARFVNFPQAVAKGDKIPFYLDKSIFICYNNVEEKLLKQGYME
jgi:hypothetical protein